MECFKITPDCTLTALHTKEMLHAIGLPQRGGRLGADRLEFAKVPRLHVS